MSLLFIVDAYNLTHHPAFKPVAQRPLNLVHALADFIHFKKLIGSSRNRLILVFDGYPPASEALPRKEGLLCVFSKKLEADQVIGKLVEKAARPQDLIVVSDDKQVQLTARLFKARFLSVRSFIYGAQGQRARPAQEAETLEPGLSYAKMREINEELKKLWF